MPLEVQFAQTESIATDLTPARVSEALSATCEKSVLSLRRLILEELRQRLPLSEITEEAREKIPALNDLPSLIAKYASCFNVNKGEDGFTLIVDRAKLRQMGLPANLPEMLEYGSEVGISAAPHLRTGWYKFLSEAASRIAEEIPRELG
jgi:hypothetical protein